MIPDLISKLNPDGAVMLVVLGKIPVAAVVSVVGCSVPMLEK
jgi:hypothetical protein